VNSASFTVFLMPGGTRLWVFPLGLPWGGSAGSRQEMCGTGAAAPGGKGLTSRRMWDAIVVGAGHNGLTAAAYLGRAGLRTLVLERRSCLGGACVTEELWPGYRVSRAAYVAGLLRPAVVRELGLEARG
jgi:hypothetical protein